MLFLWFSSSSSLGVFQCFDCLYLTLVSFRSLDNCPTRAILWTFAALQWSCSLYKGLGPRGRVDLLLYNMWGRPCIMHGRPPTLRRFLTYSRDANAANFGCWSENASCKFFRVCSSSVDLFFVLCGDIPDACSRFCDPFIAPYVHIKVLDLSNTATAMRRQIFVFIFKNNAWNFIYRFITLLSYVLNALSYSIFGCQETSCSNLVLYWIQKAPFRAARSISTLLGRRPSATSSFTSKCLAIHITLVCRQDSLHLVLRDCHLWGWWIIWLCTCWTRLCNSPCILLESIPRVVLLGRLRVCSCLGLGLLRSITTAIFRAYAFLLVQDHLLNSLVLSMICPTARGLVSLLQHACHYIIVGSLDSQVVIWSLVICGNCGGCFLHSKRLVITIPWSVGLYIIYNLFHLENMSRLLEPTRGWLEGILPLKQIFLSSRRPLRWHVHLLLVYLEVLGTGRSSLSNIILTFQGLRIRRVLFRWLCLVDSFSLIC